MNDREMKLNNMVEVLSKLNGPDLNIPQRELILDAGEVILTSGSLDDIKKLLSVKAIEYVLAIFVRRYRFPPVVLALGHPNKEVIEYIMTRYEDERCDWFEYNKDDYTETSYVIYNNDSFEIKKWFIEKYGVVDTLGAFGDSILSRLIDKNMSEKDIELVKLCADKGARIIYHNFDIYAYHEYEEYDDGEYVNLVELARECGHEDLARYLANIARNTDMFTSKVVCFSGVRDKNLEKIIESKEGKVASSLLKECNMLVVKDINSTSKKVIEAKKRGILLVRYSDLV